MSVPGRTGTRRTSCREKLYGVLRTGRDRGTEPHFQYRLEPQGEPPHVQTRLWGVSKGSSRPTTQTQGIGGGRVTDRVGGSRVVRVDSRKPRDVPWGGVGGYFYSGGRGTERPTVQSWTDCSSKDVGLDPR